MDDKMRGTLRLTAVMALAVATPIAIAVSAKAISETVPGYVLDAEYGPLLRAAPLLALLWTGIVWLWSRLVRGNGGD